MTRKGDEWGAAVGKMGRLGMDETRFKLNPSAGIKALAPPLELMVRVEREVFECARDGGLDGKERGRMKQIRGFMFERLARVARVSKVRWFGTF